MRKAGSFHRRTAWLLAALVALTMLVPAPAVGAQEGPASTQSEKPVEPGLDVIQYGDAAELATLRNLTDIAPSTVYRAKDLARYGTFTEAPPEVVQRASSGWITAGSGRRGNARNGCSGSTLVSYRGAVDVDLIGQSDPGGWTYSAEVGRSCYPA